MSRTRRSIILALITLLSIGAVLLGRWQLQRLGDRRELNAERRAALAQPSIDLSRAAPDLMLDGRQIVARGVFDTTHQLLLRGRSHRSAPGLHVVTAFEAEGSGAVVWVLRGFVASPDASTPPDSIAKPTPGQVTIAGTAYRLPVTSDRGQPLGAAATRTYRRLDRDELHGIIPTSLDAYVVLSGDAQGPGRLATVEPPVLDNGPHLSYAIQWFAIAIAIAAFGIIVIRRDGRGSPPRRAAP